MRRGRDQAPVRRRPVDRGGKAGVGSARVLVGCCGACGAGPWVRTPAAMAWVIPRSTAAGGGVSGG